MSRRSEVYSAHFSRKGERNWTRGAGKGLAPRAAAPHIPIMPDIAIGIENLTKRFGDVVAVENLSFDARQGEIVGLLGGNGAGKTTTISMILGLLIPTSGSLEVLGTNMLRHRYQVLPRINFSSPYVDLPKRLTSRENLMVYSKLYGVPDPARRLGELAADLAIDGLLDRRFGELSSGQKTRVSPGEIPAERTRSSAARRTDGVSRSRHGRLGAYLSEGLSGKEGGDHSSRIPQHGRGRTPVRPSGDDETGQHHGPRQPCRTVEKIWPHDA